MAATCARVAAMGRSYAVATSTSTNVSNTGATNRTMNSQAL